MSSLAEFLLARIEEAQVEAWAEIHDDSGYMVEIGWSPQLVIAHTEAVRVAVEACVDRGRAYKGERLRPYPRDNTAEAVLRALALPYASHPDYREKWRP